jgi:hypothetical protein
MVAHLKPENHTMFSRPSRLKDIPGIGVDRLGNAADAMADPGILRLENLDTDLRPWPGALAETRRAVDDDAATATCPSWARTGCARPPAPTFRA